MCHESLNPEEIKDVAEPHIRRCHFTTSSLVKMENPYRRSHVLLQFRPTSASAIHLYYLITYFPKVTTVSASIMPSFTIVKLDANQKAHDYKTDVIKAITACRSRGLSSLTSIQNLNSWHIHCSPTAVRPNRTNSCRVSLPHVCG